MTEIPLRFFGSARRASKEGGGEMTDIGRRRVPLTYVPRARTWQLGVRGDVARYRLEVVSRTLFGCIRVAYLH
eukprot:COSAG01_NODE_1998_length_8689_cov_36.410943_9_plen_73_part_00